MLARVRNKRPDRRGTLRRINNHAKLGHPGWAICPCLRAMVIRLITNSDHQNEVAK